MNLCTGCGQDFSKAETFDRHRVGVHEFTYAEGLAMEPMREDGRRCLSIAEMREKGWEQDDLGRWFDPARLESSRSSWQALEARRGVPGGDGLGEAA